MKHRTGPKISSRDPHAVVDVAQDRRRHVPAPGQVGGALAAGHHPGAAVDGEADVALDAAALSLGHERADHGRRVVRVAERDRLGRRGGGLQRLVVAGAGTHAAVRPAHLARQVHARLDHPRDHGGQVGVVEQDRRGLPAELQRHAGDALAAQAHDPPARGGRPREGDLVGAGVGDEVLADLAAAGDDVHHAGRDPGLVEGLGEHEVVEGASGGGLTTTVQPAARAGATFHADSVTGAFHGTMAATTPTGSGSRGRRGRR